MNNNKIKSIAVVVTSFTLLAGGLWLPGYLGSSNANAEPPLQAQEDTVDFEEENFSLDISKYIPYEKYGMTYNPTEERFYYEGKVVRYFKDTVDKDSNIVGFSFPDGEVDIIASRGTDYELTGLVLLDENEFKERTKVFDASQNALEGVNAHEEGTFVPDDSLSSYTEYGISYDPENDLWLYDNHVIHALSDEGYRHYLSYDQEAVDSGLKLIVSRNSHGEIIGIEDMTADEFKELFE